MGRGRREDPPAGHTVRWTARLLGATLATAILLTAAPAHAWTGQHRWERFRTTWLDRRDLSLTCPGNVGPDMVVCHQWRLNHRAWVGWARERARIAQARALTTTIPAAAGVPVSAGATYSGSVPDLVRSIFGPSASACALMIANRESGFDPSAHNPSGAAGIFQLMPFWWQSVYHFDPYNAYENIYHAHLIYLSSGWGPWGGC